MHTATLSRASATTIAPMTNADIDDCARMLVLADRRKHGRWTRPDAVRYIAEALAGPAACAYVWRDARCAPAAFALGRRVGMVLCISELCAPGDGLQLLQQMQLETGVDHVELDCSQGAGRVARLLRTL
jgi:hypothetical protein